LQLYFDVLAMCNQLQFQGQSGWKENEVSYAIVAVFFFV